MHHPNPPGEKVTPLPLVVTLGALTVVSGFLDAVSYLGLGHVFTANMTGNIVLLGFAAAGAAGFSVAASLCALGSFLAGAVRGLPGPTDPPQPVSDADRHDARGRGHRDGRGDRATVTVVGSGAPRYTVIAMLAFTMGARNVVVRRLGVPDMTTTVLTTTLTGLAADSTLAGGANPNVRNRATSVVSMFSGALAGAALLLHAGAAWSLGVASVIVAVATTFFAVGGAARAHPGLVLSDASPGVTPADRPRGRRSRRRPAPRPPAGAADH